VSTQRVYVHADIEAEFIERFTARVCALRVGDPLRLETEVGPLIQPREADRVSSWVEEAVAGGGQAVVGGERRSETTLSPTVLLNPPREARVSREEVFGPVTCVYRYTDLDQAIAAANALPVAFQASVFAQDIDVALHAAERLDASAVMVNDHTAFRTDWMPFAGRRQSGYGVGGIPYSMREMTQEKMIVLRRSPDPRPGSPEGG
jgi:acyl-CoA reductase-like NAD-dependent aldehyde dehydrogenase